LPVPDAWSLAKCIGKVEFKVLRRIG